MRTAASGKPETPAAENIDSILRLEKQDEKTLAVHHRILPLDRVVRRDNPIFRSSVRVRIMLGRRQSLFDAPNLR